MADNARDIGNRWQRRPGLGPLLLAKGRPIHMAFIPNLLVKWDITVSTTNNLAAHPPGQVLGVLNRRSQCHKLLEPSLPEDSAKRFDFGSSARVSKNLEFVRDNQRAHRVELTCEDEPQRLFICGNHQPRVDVAFSPITSIKSDRANRLTSPLPEPGHEIQILLIRQSFVRYEIDRPQVGTQS